MSEQVLKINGEEKPFLMSTAVLRALGRRKGMTDKPIEEVMTNITFDDYDFLIYGSLKLGAQAEGEKFEEDFETVQKWLDEDLLALQEAEELIVEATAEGAKNALEIKGDVEQVKN